MINGITSGSSYSIIFELGKEEKGTVWINPSWNELKVELDKKYEWPLEYKSEKPLETKLIYKIDNADKNATFNFTYQNKEKLSNPFSVCHGEECQDNVETYNFTKGESYKINIKTVKVTEDKKEIYYFPSFEFKNVNSPEPVPSYSLNLRSNLLAISLLLLLSI